ncbi:MAG: ATP-binding cassette domain-containing protein [Chloroflexota bacterium]
MIELRELEFRYNEAGIGVSPRSPLIFQDFDWQVAHGESWAVLGPSGCGKSTLLYLLAGLHSPTGGAVWVDGEQLAKPRPKTGLILQNYGLLPWATVRQNVSLGLRMRRFYGPDGRHAPSEAIQENAQAHTAHWLERVGIVDVADKYPSQISGGQGQRAAIARTLVLNPDLLLMDEPFASLDAPTRSSLQQLVRNLQAEQNLTTVIVTHSIEEAAVLGEKILVLGEPPNCNPEIIFNLRAADADYPETIEYQQLCSRLRTQLEAGG